MATMIQAGSICIDGGTQPRAFLDVSIVQEYAAQMAAGARFPSLTVFFDGARYWLADGFHRFHARTDALGDAEVECDVRQGTQRDAILYSCGANAAHGMRRTNQDKRRAVMRMLEDREWRGWSNREIARHCSVDEGTVRNLKGEMVTAEFPQSRAYMDRHGNVSTMNTTNIGRRPIPATHNYDGRHRQIPDAPGARPNPVLSVLRESYELWVRLPKPKEAAFRAGEFDAGQARSVADWWREFAACLE